MAKDLIYYVSKESTTIGAIEKAFKRNEFGEVQQTFNMSFTLDGTKDSVHFQVVSYTQNIIEPYTILWHESTNTWWVATNDKVNRYANESGYMYVHEIDCLGAIELLNARDLTDHGYRSNKYTISDFLNRLIKMSNVEFDVLFYYQNIDQTQVVDYIKTFENYTLLSALREFLNGYNHSPKLRFQTIVDNSDYYVYRGVIDIIPKTGNTNLTTLDIDDFKDIRETRNFDKNSFGTTVVTNAQNVVSTKVKTYPSGGNSIKLSANAKETTYENAILRLPSNVYKVNWVKMIIPTTLRFRYTNGITTGYFDHTISLYNFDREKEVITNYINGTPEIGDSLKEDAIANIDSITRNTLRAMSVMFYNNDKYNGISDEFEDLTNISGYYQPEITVRQGNLQANQLYGGACVLTPKEVRDCVDNVCHAFYWERGKNYLGGFEFLSNISGNRKTYMKITSTELGSDSQTFYENTIDGWTLKIFLYVDTDPWNVETLTISNVSFIVNYVPMSDLKILTNNDNQTNDIQIYNQNGKLTDSVALSKLINSYANEITNENITRYSDYYNFSDLPSVGQLVNDNGTLYVINNISLDFYQNEQNGSVSYKIECEVSMSKAIAVKSLMVNANSNIRDYGIPQTNNIARKQVYRDIWEFNYLNNSNADNDYYVGIDKIMNLDTLGFTNVPTSDEYELIGLIKTTFSDNNSWYYQLCSNRYELKKQVIYELDFQDNNIIGYDMQNQFSGFDINRILTGTYDTMNTPISYVDDNGEVEDIDILFTTFEQIQNVSDYISQRQHCFIGSGVFTATKTNNYYYFELNESEYNKDALEIPVFEYACQVRSNDNIIVGQDFLNITFRDNFNTSGYLIIFYGFAIQDNITEENALDYATQEVQSAFAYSLDNACQISLNTGSRMLFIDFYESMSFYHQQITYGNGYTIESEKDIAIYRYIYNTSTHETKKELVLIAKNVVDTNISGNTRLILVYDRFKK